MLELLLILSIGTAIVARILRHAFKGDYYNALTFWYIGAGLLALILTIALVAINRH